MLAIYFQGSITFFDKTGNSWIEVDFSSWTNREPNKEKFEVLKEAIMKKQAIAFTYLSSYGDNTYRVAYPLKLIFKSKFWYIQGYCLLKQEYRTFKINRMQNIKLLPESFTDKQFSPPPIELPTNTSYSIIFIHGWPTCWLEFETVMMHLSEDYHVIAMDLPGIGDSEVPLQLYSKRNIAEYVRGIMDAMNLSDVTLVGCDVGGQIIYAFLKSFPSRISHAVIMNVAIPGVEPWDAVKSNPYLWHFAFHSVSELPEKLVAGNEMLYFSYFYDVLAGKGKKMSDARRKSYAEAYARPNALKAGFDLYRCFALDEKDNIASKDIVISLPILYLRGEDEHTNIEIYMNGFGKNGLKNIEAKVIENCGHFSAEEQPEKVASAIREFIKTCNQ